MNNIGDAIIEYVEPMYIAYRKRSEEDNARSVINADPQEVMYFIKQQLHLNYEKGIDDLPNYKTYDVTDPCIPVLLEYYAVAKTYCELVLKNKYDFSGEYNYFLETTLEKIVCCIRNMILRRWIHGNKYLPSYYIEFLELEFKRFGVFIPTQDGIDFIFFSRTFNNIKPIFT